jgi:LysR family transcriptional regulator for bpeEF and oprC
MDRLEAMEVFARVAELGSFTRAADALRQPRSTVTARVQALEARLGVKLLHRTTRRVSLTPDGAAYLREARRLLREVDELESGLGTAAASPRGRVRVDVPAAAGRHVIVPALPSFFARYPDVVLELGSSDRPVDLLAEGVDCVLRGGEVHDESLAARKLAELSVVTCASPAYLAAHGTPRTLDDLEEHTFVAFFSPRTGRTFDPEFGDRPYPARHQLAVNDADAWLAAALAGLGLVQLPVSHVIRGHLDRGELVRVLADHDCGSLPLHALYPRSRRLPARVRVFLDWVAELYAAHG